jgi:hypothetical protein
MQHVYAPLPDRVSIAVARRIAVELEGIVNRTTGGLVDAHITDLILTDQERRVLARAIDVALAAAANDLVEFQFTTDQAITVLNLADRLDPDGRTAVIAAAVAEPVRTEELTRQQEYAADAMAAEYGRSRVRRLSDGAVVVVGMTDDVERATRCVERDGTERWRS